MVVAGRGDFGAIAKSRGWPGSSVRQRVAAHKRGDPAPRLVGGVEKRLTPEALGRDTRVHREGTWADFTEHRFILSREKDRNESTAGFGM